MLKYKVVDLKKVRKSELLDLRKLFSVPTRDLRKFSMISKSATKKPDFPSLDLRSLSTERSSLFSSKASKKIDTLKIIKKRNQAIIIKNSPNFAIGFEGAAKVAIAGFFVVFLINFFNILAAGNAFRTSIITNASSAVDNMYDGLEKSKNLNLDVAEKDFLEAQMNFETALEKISFLKTSPQFSHISEMQSLEGVLTAGKKISESAKLFSSSGARLKNWPDLFLQANLAAIRNNQMNSNSTSLTAELKGELENIKLAIQKLREASDALNMVDINILPSAYQAAFPQIKDNIKILEEYLSGLSEHFTAILKLLGDRYPHRYLILFQNDAESRPTGGFIGSLMIVDVNDGIITTTAFHDVYEFDGQLQEQIDAPEDISMITDQWRLRDSNYSPDFAISAEKAAWFLQKSKGPSVDTVIAINQSAIADLLTVVGPIQIPELKGEITSSNFQLILSYLIESKYYGEDNPKLILEKTIQNFKNQIGDLDNFDSLIDELRKAIWNNKIMFYSRDEDIQAFFETLNLTPHQQEIGEKEDYLQVIATSIGGNKSDKYIKQTLTHNTYIDTKGNIADELTVTRQHTWNEETEASINDVLKNFGFSELPQNIASILGDSKNVSSIKVYVPFGAELENVVGIDQTEVKTRYDAELSKTYFLFPMSIDPDEEQSVTLRYRLPYTLSFYPADIYRFTAQKQLAIYNSDLVKKLNYSPPLSILKENIANKENPMALKDTYNYRAILLK